MCIPVTTTTTHVCEEDLETTEGEGVDLLSQLLELVGWPQVNDKETEKDLSLLLFDKLGSTWTVFCLYTLSTRTLKQKVHA